MDVASTSDEGLRRFGRARGGRNYPWLFLETVLAHGWWCGFSVQPPGCVWDVGHSDIATLGMAAVASPRGVVIIYHHVFHMVPQSLPPDVAIWVHFFSACHLMCLL